MNTNLGSPGRHSAPERHLQGPAMLWTMALASWTPRHLQGCRVSPWQHPTTFFYESLHIFSPLLPKFLGLLPAPVSPDSPPLPDSGAQKTNGWDDASLQDVPE